MAMSGVDLGEGMGYLEPHSRLKYWPVTLLREAAAANPPDYCGKRRLVHAGRRFFIRLITLARQPLLHGMMPASQPNASS